MKMLVLLQIAQSMILMPMPGMFIMKEVPGMFYNACQMTAHHYGAEYIIVDLSPSSAIFNRFAVMSSHGLIIPMHADVSVSFSHSLQSALFDSEGHARNAVWMLLFD